MVDEALIINEGDQPVRLRVYAAEAATAVNGGTAFGHQNDNSSDGVADWIKLGAGEVSLQPGETQVVPFTITVPTDTSPGDHVAGLLVEPAPTGNETYGGATAEEPQFAVQVVQRVGVAVVIDVPGDRVAGLAITDVRLGQQHEQGAVFEVAVHKTGNVIPRRSATRRQCRLWIPAVVLRDGLDGREVPLGVRWEGLGPDARPLGDAAVGR